MASQQQTSQANGRKVAEQAVGSAREMIEGQVGKENLDSFLTILAPIGDFSLRALRTTFGYARRHPVRIGMTVVAIGLLGTWLAGSRKTESSYLH